MLLLFCAVAASWFIWHRSGWWAIPFIAFATLVKPFYVLLFAAFGLLMLTNTHLNRRESLRSLVIAAGGSLLLIAVDVVLWGGTLRTEAWAYLSHSLDYTWYALPSENQYPLNVWNRTAMQGFVNAGVGAGIAQQLSLVTWLVLLGITLWRARTTQLTFRLAFALALILMYWARPVGWGLVFLEVVMVLAVWERLRRPERIALTVAMVGLALSRWVVLGQTANGETLNLFTFQTAQFPWEVWLLLPACWLVLVLSTWRSGDVQSTVNAQV